MQGLENWRYEIKVGAGGSMEEIDGQLLEDHVV